MPRRILQSRCSGWPHWFPFSIAHKQLVSAEHRRVPTYGKHLSRSHNVSARYHCYAKANLRSRVGSSSIEPTVSVESQTHIACISLLSVFCVSSHYKAALLASYCLAFLACALAAAAVNQGFIGPRSAAGTTSIAATYPQAALDLCTAVCNWCMLLPQPATVSLFTLPLALLLALPAALLRWPASRGMPLSDKSVDAHFVRRTTLAPVHTARVPDAASHWCLSANQGRLTYQQHAAQPYSKVHIFSQRPV